MDVGCGNGVALSIFENYFQNLKYYGCDFQKRDNWEVLKIKMFFYLSKKLKKK